MEDFGVDRDTVYRWRKRLKSPAKFDAELEKIVERCVACQARMNRMDDPLTMRQRAGRTLAARPPDDRGTTAMSKNEYHTLLAQLRRRAKQIGVSIRHHRGALQMGGKVCGYEFSECLLYDLFNYDSPTTESKIGWASGLTESEVEVALDKMGAPS